MKKMAQVIFLAVLSLAIGCTAANNLKDAAGGSDVVATENWNISVAGGTGGVYTLQKMKDGTIAVSGTWTNSVSTCPFSGGIMTISNIYVSFSGYGTATTSVDSSYFTLMITNTVATNGYMKGIGAIMFSTAGWGTNITNFTGILSSGSGITTNF